MSAARTAFLDRTIFAVLVAFGILFAQEPCAAQSDAEDSLPSNQMLVRYGLERAWWSQATINPNRSRVRYITLDEDLLYIQTTGGIITAFDNETGRKLWARQIGQKDEPSHAAVSNLDSVYVAVGLYLYSIDKFSGQIIWKLRLPKLPSSSPTVDEDQIYFGTLDGSVFAYSVHGIRDLYVKNLLPDYSHNALRWRYKAGEEIISPAVSTGRTVNFASRDGSLYAVTTELRKLIWQFETDATLSAPLGHTQDSIVVASEDFNVYCINAANGAFRWKPFVLGYPIRQQPRVIDSDIYLMSDRGGLFCLSLDTGNRLWWSPNVSGFLAATRNRLFLSGDIGSVVILSRENGSFVAAIPLRQFSVRLANDRTDRLYLSTPSGLVVCIRELGRPFPTYHMFPDRLPIVPEIAGEVEADAQAQPADTSN